MPHPSENLLGLYALDPALVPARRELENHLSACADCRRLLDSILEFDAVLRDPDTWLPTEPMENDETIGELREFAARVADEDASAAELLSDFENPDADGRFSKLVTSFIWTEPATKPIYQTGGVARRLCKLANRMCERKPLYALALAEAATAISNVLEPTSYPRDTIHELRGETWKEQANALHHLGRFDDALRALQMAESEYRRLRHSGLGMVAVKYVRAAVLYEQERYDEAEALAEDAAIAAFHLGAVDYSMRARNLQGEIRFECQRFAEAAQVFATILTYGEDRADTVWIARESLNLGNCSLALGDLSAADAQLARARELFISVGLGVEVTRTEWAQARLSFAQGRSDWAVGRLRTVIAALSGHGMLTDAAIASVDLAEMLHAGDRSREIPAVLAGVVRTFTVAGKLTGALSALAYLKDAAIKGAIAPPLFGHVRKFIARVDHQADLIFAPPPL